DGLTRETRMVGVDPGTRGAAQKPPASLRGLLAAVLLAVLAGAVLAPGPARAKEDKPREGKAPPQGADHPDKKAGAPKKPNPLEHVADTKDWHLFETKGIEIHLPRVAGVQITKFMVLELIAALLVMAIYIPLARRVASGEPPRGWWDNTFEVLLTFVRNDVARPGIGEHDADRFVPFLWTLFLFILFNNLLGMLPFAGSPTASIYVTGALALCVFFAIHGSATAKMGFWHYLKSYWPQIEVPFMMGIVLKPLIFVLELNGALVRNLVLAVRL